MTSPKTKVVVVGGGTGTYTLLRGLREYHNRIDIAAIVTMADSGGSTGRLRDAFGQLPVGDVRQALSALAPDVPGAPNLLRDLFLYRFQTGEGLAGHNFGNLFLTALTDMLGSEALAIEAAADLLRICGRVIPVTTDKVHLQAKFTSGRIVVGEHSIDEPDQDHQHDRIMELSLTPHARLSPEAKEVIHEADVVVFGPGDFYTSILANTVVEGFADALAASRAMVIFVANLMARPGQTIGMHLEDYLREFKRYVQTDPDIVIIPDAPLPTHLVRLYEAAEAVHPILYELGDTFKTVLHPATIVSHQAVSVQAGDVLARSFIRHDSAALAETIMALLHS